MVLPTLPAIRGMRQEATLLGEGVSCLRFSRAKRILSFGFDEMTKLIDGLAASNNLLQIKTELEAISDELMRRTLLIAGGTADQVSHDNEIKPFSRGRRILN